MRDRATADLDGRGRHVRHLDEDASGTVICRQLQRAAYLGTLLAAAALGKHRVVLTLIGDGVFANPITAIWDAILWAADHIAAHLHADLSIIVNGRNLGAELPPAELAAAACARGGDLVHFGRTGATLTHRESAADDRAGSRRFRNAIG